MQSMVICLCANWCGLCRDFINTFRQLALTRPTMRFVWVDIEDCELWQDEEDIETFPSLCIVNETGKLRFFGPVQPSVNALNRLFLEVNDPLFHAPIPSTLNEFILRLNTQLPPISTNPALSINGLLSWN